ncbi:hypothetical protein BDP55DRAFT_632199 [Colletotrichum godetiae]|uniref:Uncharacterized protein n=1 Tax=Colletotrichum godetiae TaxID=1209918 RepID=A0AAJ0AKE8_9PEZI|nr:uncharacterized protein BDP55DRAFT_632199 [Colletotrichum godetiae]KAK1675521.1 hypothetical protein BDP55DRAFT_632199 [Colletotrichum godetiae]
MAVWVAGVFSPTGLSPSTNTYQHPSSRTLLTGELTESLWIDWYFSRLDILTHKLQGTLHFLISKLSGEAPISGTPPSPVDIGSTAGPSVSPEHTSSCLPTQLPSSPKNKISPTEAPSNPWIPSS